MIPTITISNQHFSKDQSLENRQEKIKLKGYMLKIKNKYCNYLDDIDNIVGCLHRKPKESIEKLLGLIKFKRTAQKKIDVKNQFYFFKPATNQ